VNWIFTLGSWNFPFRRNSLRNEVQTTLSGKLCSTAIYRASTLGLHRGSAAAAPPLNANLNAIRSGGTI